MAVKIGIVGKQTTPDNITNLGPNEIFVFGSNTAGIHGRGAALQAYKQFGCPYGFGEGLHIESQTYAFPTLAVPKGRKSFSLEPRTDDELLASVRKLYETAQKNPNLTFLLTKVGCGLAGYEESHMITLFRGTPANIVKPKGW